MARFAPGQKIEYKTWDGDWYTGTIVDGPDSFGDYSIDATVYEYSPQYVTRSAQTIREVA